MNYYTLRIWILIFLGILIFSVCWFFIPKRIRRSKTFYEILIVIISLLFFLFWMIPYEKFFVKFDRVEQAFRYYFPNGRIIKKLEGNRYTYLFYSKDEQENFVYFVQDGSSWKFDDKTKRGSAKITEIDGYTIYFNSSKDQKTTALVVTFPEYLMQSITIQDSMNHEFLDKIYKKDGITYTLYAFMIDGTLSDDYTIYINEKAYTLKDFS